MAHSNEAHPDDLDELERKYLAPNFYFNKADEAAEQHHQGDEQDGGGDSDWSMGEDEHQEGLEMEQLFDPRNAQVVDEAGWSSVLSQNREKGNTGGKGVLADYKEATAITKRRNETKALKQREAWKRVGYGGQQVQSSSSAAAQAKNNADSESDSDDEFFAKFRAARLAQFSSVSSLPQYGRVQRVGKFEFVDAVDQANAGTFVVIHLFEDYLLACERMNTILDDLASRFPHVQFLKLRATDADQLLSHKSLPAFLVYRAGNLVSDAVVNFGLDTDKFTAEDVEYMLAKKYGVNLPGVDVSEREKVPAAT